MGKGALRKRMTGDGQRRRIKRTSRDDPISKVPGQRQGRYAGKRTDGLRTRPSDKRYKEEDWREDEGNVLYAEIEPEAHAPDDPIVSLIPLGRDDAKENRRQEHRHENHVDICANGVFDDSPAEQHEGGRIDRGRWLGAGAARQCVHEQAEQQVERKLSDASKEIAVERQHERKEEELAIRRRVSGRLIAEWCRDNPNAVCE